MYWTDPRRWTAHSALRRPPARRQALLDVALAATFALVGVRYAVNTPDQQFSPVLTPLSVALAAAPLAVRRRYPLATLWLLMAGAFMLRDAFADVVFYACLLTLVAVYNAVAHGPYREPTLASLPVAAALLVLLFEHAALPHFPNAVVGLLVVFPVVMAAVGHRVWAGRAEQGRARLAALEGEQAEALRHAVEEERARIARELHDVVTHNVSVMVIQAGAGRMMLDADPEQTREALLAIETGGRAAMGELRHVMGLLTMDSAGDRPAATAETLPQPGLDGLEGLVGRIRAAGLPVELSVTGERRPLPPGVELAAYRVVQEALTNAVKHAQGANAVVRVAYGAHQLTVEVTNTEGTPGEAAGTGNGRGLIGLRERVAVYGGTLQTGRRLTGGYRVKALIPLEAL
ncbi:sensor histidine kinase [Kitasatospora azatica]|uniref:sensor histidine kinase n=1 Tax=Kitasatospora azatica TaxID=58347 RepID=UPI00069205DC|nr:histidine kinase [Kitasatospora azatica]